MEDIYDTETPRIVQLFQQRTKTVDSSLPRRDCPFAIAPLSTVHTLTDKITQQQKSYDTRKKQTDDAVGFC